MVQYLPYLLLALVVSHAGIALAAGNPLLALDKTSVILVSAWIGYHIGDKF